MLELQKDTFIYFAYGSNLLTERLQARCPSATFIGHANANGYKLVFNKESFLDNSAKANLFHTGNNTDIVEGSLFVINKNEESLLNDAEGYDKEKYREGKSYSRDTISVSYNSEQIPAVTYKAHISNETTDLPIHDWYFALIVAGALQHELSKDYIEKLIKGKNMQVDADLKRPRRLEALSVLEQAGYLTTYVELSKTVEDNPTERGQ